MLEFPWKVRGVVSRSSWHFSSTDLSGMAEELWVFIYSASVYQGSVTRTLSWVCGNCEQFWHARRGMVLRSVTLWGGIEWEKWWTTFQNLLCCSNVTVARFFHCCSIMFEPHSSSTREANNLSLLFVMFFLIDELNTQLWQDTIIGQRCCERKMKHRMS